MKVKDKLEKLLANVGDMALKRRAKVVIEDLELKDGDRVLDLGCGNGYFSYLFSSLPLKLKITGIDNHKDAILDAKRLINESKVRFLVGTAERLPFPNGFFDKIVMSEVIEHVEDDLKVLKEARRVLRKGGKIVLTTPNKNYPFFWDPVNWLLEHLFNLHIKSGFWAGIWNQHLRLYKPQELKRQVETAGFKNVSVKVLTKWCLPFNHYLLNLGARLLYDKKLAKNLLQDINKFIEVPQRKTFVAQFFFWIVNTVDKLNDSFPDSSGVSILIIAS